jgi:hypothetical protein
VPYETLTTEIENRENRVGLGDTRGKNEELRTVPYGRRRIIFKIISWFLTTCCCSVYGFQKNLKKKNSHVPTTWQY